MILIHISCVCLVLALAEAAYLGQTCSLHNRCTVRNSFCQPLNSQPIQLLKVNITAIGICQCEAGFWQYPNNRYSCQPKRVPGYSCNLNYPNVDQCVDNAVCQTSYTANQGRNFGSGDRYYYNNAICMCMPGYHSTGIACEPRIDLGEPCVYHETWCNECRDSGDGQCKEHAACRTHVDASGTTTHICKCVEKYYVERDGVCVKEIPLGGTCNHNGENECVTDNAECVAKDGKSTCGCSDGYEQDGNHDCVVSTGQGNGNGNGNGNGQG